MTRLQTIMFRGSVTLTLASLVFWNVWLATNGSIPQDTVLGVEISRAWAALLAPVPVCLTAYLERQNIETGRHALNLGAMTWYMFAWNGFLWSHSDLRLSVVFLTLGLVLAVAVFVAERIGRVLRPWILAEELSPRP